MSKPLQLLMVEDNAADAELILRQLEQAGFDPRWRRVKTEAEFVAALDEPPELILSDFSMPQFDGIRALALLKERQLDIPFILISGTLGEETAVEVMKQGAFDYLLKDRTARLGPSIEKALEARELRSEHRRAEEQVRIQLSALEAAAHAIVITNRRGEVEWANPAFSSITGYSLAEVARKNIRFLKSGRHEAALYRSLWATILAGKVWEGELINRRKDGSLYPEFMTITPVRGLWDRIERFIAVKQDISERKRTEEQLRAAHAKLSAFFTGASAGLAILSRDFRYVQINETLAAVSGVSVQQHLGRSLVEVLPRVAPVMIPLMEQVVNTGRPVLDQELSGETPVEPGVIRHWVASFFPIFDAANVVESLGAVVVEISARRRLELELRESERRFRDMMGKVELISMMLDLEARVTYCNDYLLRLIDRPRAEVIGQNWFELCVPPGHDEVKAVFSALLADLPSAWHHENEIVIRSGERRLIQWNNSVLRSVSGDVIGTASIGEDITERKRAEAALRESEIRFRQLAENINEVFWVTDPSKHEMLYISPAYESIWGRTCDSLYAAPRNWLDAIHPEDRRRVMEAATARQVKGDYDEVYRIIRPDGSLRWIHDRAFPVPDAAGRIYRVVGTAEDITERKLAEEKLREQATLLDKARDAILVRDLEHRILYWNQGAERLYGWSAEEAVGRNVTELLYRDPAGYHAAMEVLRSTGEWAGELEQVTKAGKPATVDGRWTLVRDDRANPVSVLAIDTDITQRKKLEAQFLRAQRMESIGTLAGGIAHDLNNMLAPILVSIELLGDEITSEDGRSMLQTIQSCAQRGADLVRQVLTFARGVEGERIEVHLEHLLRDVRQVIRETFPKDIQISLERPNDVWPVVGDPTQLHQVFMNLSVNARDAMPRGGRLDISTQNVLLDGIYSSMEPDAKRGPHVVITFADTGTGITPEIRERIFEPFFTTKEIGKGTGLGLSTVMAIVRSHGGFINVYSEPGKGTTFKIYLPASECREARVESSPGTGRFPRGAGQVVLVVDDEAGIRELTGKTLERYGYRVLLAANGAEAVALYARHREEIAVVLTDMAMPVMDGPATIVALQALNPTVKIVCSSGLASSEGIVRTLNAGIHSLLSKPYTAEAILKALAAALAEPPGAPGSRHTLQ